MRNFLAYDFCLKNFPIEVVHEEIESFEKRDRFSKVKVKITTSSLNLHIVRSLTLQFNFIDKNIFNLISWENFQRSQSQYTFPLAITEVQTCTLSTRQIQNIWCGMDCGVFKTMKKMFPILQLTQFSHNKAIKPSSVSTKRRKCCHRISSYWPTAILHNTDSTKPN